MHQLHPGRTLALAPVQALAHGHTLLLTGELHHLSAHRVEEEIEHLCDAGVPLIALDLRELAYIDSISVMVIAFRFGLCTRRGHELTVIAEPGLVRRALETAGVPVTGAGDPGALDAELLPASEVALPRRPRAEA